MILFAFILLITSSDATQGQIKAPHAVAQIGPFYSKAECEKVRENAIHLSIFAKATSCFQIGH